MSPTERQALALEGAQTIQTALDLLGAGGDRWTGGTDEKGRAFTPDPTRGGFDYCVIGALIAAAPDYASYEAAYHAVKETVGGNIARWNNRSETTFQDVSVTLRRAANNLREAA